MNPHKCGTFSIVTLAIPDELGKLVGDFQRLALDHYLNAVTRVIEKHGSSAMLLPAAEVTTYHEAGHAVLFAAIGKVPSEVKIWHEPKGKGYAGHCDFPPDAPKLHIHTGRNPRAAITYGCTTFAGWIAEWVFARDGYLEGSSLDERITGECMLMSAAASLGINQVQIRDAAYHVVVKILLEEKVTVCALQRRLVAEHRISGTDLAAMLTGVTQRDVATFVLAKCQTSRMGGAATHARGIAPGTPTGKAGTEAAASERWGGREMSVIPARRAPTPDLLAITGRTPVRSSQAVTAVSIATRKECRHE